MRSWTVLLGLSIIFVLVAYRITHRPLVSAVIAALVATGAVQVLARIELGYLDELWPIAAAVSFGATFVLSLLVAFGCRRFGSGNRSTS